MSMKLAYAILILINVAAALTGFLIVVLLFG